MNSAELANFKNKLAIKLDTTTNEEAQLVSSMVDNASGGGGGILPIGLTFSETVITFNRTWQEVYNAIASGVLPVILNAYENNQAIVAFVIYAAGSAELGYNINVYMPDADEPVQSFICTSADEYPYQIMK